MASSSVHDLTDFHEVIRFLEEHPEWQAELRRVLLTKDLLALPEQMTQLISTVRELAATQARTEQQLSTLIAAQARTEQQIGTLTEQVMMLTKTTQGLQDDMGRVKGIGLETRLRLSGSPFFGVLLRKPSVLSRGEVTDLLDEAESQGLLTPTESREIQLADLIVYGLRRDDRAPVYLVVEVSWTIDTDDVRRAASRASLLAKTGTTVLPVVAGEKIGGRAAELSRAMRVWQMTDEEVIPPSASGAV
jgi:hypothetical protein